MKILLNGSARDAGALLDALTHANDHEITHCADGARVIAELLKQGYDWAIIDGRTANGGETDFARIIRMMGPKALGTAGACAHAEKSGMHAACGVEWSKTGVLQLHCAMHSLVKETPGPWRVEGTCLGEILFEYHAPCNKGRRRDG